MTNDPSLMDNEFHDWLDQCPNNWVRLAFDKDSSTYMFYKKDDDDYEPTDEEMMASFGTKWHDGL